MGKVKYTENSLSECRAKNEIFATSSKLEMGKGDSEIEKS